MTYEELEEMMAKKTDKYGLNSTMTAENQDGEQVIITRYEDAIVVETLQKNGWIRKNVYHKDGAKEESYKK